MDERIIKLVDWVENFDGHGNHAMIMERGRKDGDLSKILKGGHLNECGALVRVSIAKNLLEIGQVCLNSHFEWQ